MYVYVLELAEGKFYVGETNDMQKRLEQHRTSRGSEWTKKYPVKSIYDLKKFSETESISDIASIQENKRTIEIMKEKGIDNVRGGDFVRFELSMEEYSALFYVIFNKYNSCMRCGREKHRSKECWFKNTVDGDEIKDYSQKSEPLKLFDLVELQKKIASYVEFQCNYIEMTKQDTKLSVKPVFWEPKRVYNCGRCGRPGHTKTKCNAKTHSKGHELS